MAHQSKTPEYAPQLVKADDIARAISCSSRHVRNLAEKNKIPSIRISKSCVRFDPLAVAKALGFEWRAVLK